MKPCIDRSHGCAQPGAGKTTLVASYASARKRGGIWYQLDAGDADPASFVYHLNLAIDAASRRGGTAALPLLTPEYLEDIDGFARRHFRLLFERLPADSLVVLDGLHEVPDESPLHRLLAVGMGEIPAGLNIVVTSRAEPPARYAPLMAGEAVGLVGGDALRLTPDETVMLARQRGVDDATQARFDVGRGRITELQEAQARLDAVATREVSARSTLALRQAQYEALTGATAMGLAALPSALQPTPPQPDSVAEWQALGRAQQPRVQAKALELAIATAEIEKQALAARPTLDLVGSMTLKGQGGSLTSVATPQDRRTAAVGLQFSVPLFAGALDSKLREAVARRDEAEQSLAAARRDAALQVEDAFLGVHTGMARIASLEQSERSARTALEATTLGRDVGTRTDPDVLDAQQRLHAALLDLAQARGDWLLGHIRLAQSAGVLQESDLRALNAQLHP